MHVLITAGPTREYFDSVRYISNGSTGKMGFAIAEAAAARGHKVTLVTGPVALADIPGVDLVRVTTAQEMLEAASAAFAACDAAIMTAAVCDYRPEKTSKTKLKKTGDSMTVTLVPCPDILAELGKKKGDRVVVGFAMEDTLHHTHAEQKLIRKNCDAIVLNSVTTVGQTDASVEVFRADLGWTAPIMANKQVIGDKLVKMVEELSTGKQASVRG